MDRAVVTIGTKIKAPVDKVWNIWNDPGHIKRWNAASSDWHTPRAINFLKQGQKFMYRMEAKDGSAGFDFSGTYNKIEPHKKIDYTLDDGRKVEVSFIVHDKETIIKQVFQAETDNSVEEQQKGWKAILENFRNYVETMGHKEILHFEILINASPEEVFNTMIDDQHYRQWTSVFDLGSHFEGSWQKSSKILFLGENNQGMSALIRENIPNRFISIQYLGVIKEGKELTSGPEVESWAGALENYAFVEMQGKTMVVVDVDTNSEFRDHFMEKWPQALDKLKRICEEKL